MEPGPGAGGEGNCSDFPQMENRDLGWIDLGLGNPKTVFSAKNIGFCTIFGNFPLFGGFPWVPYWALLAPLGPAAGAKPLDLD